MREEKVRGRMVLTLVIRAVISFTTKHDKNEAFEFFFISNVCDPESSGDPMKSSMLAAPRPTRKNCNKRRKGPCGSQRS
ncbi:hypothetical protein YC2023_106601 [Brassica napus]